jgi:hypothetical protein
MKSKKCKHNLAESEIIFVDTPYNPNCGAFARTQKIEDDRHKVDHWFFCRDLFHNVLWNLKIFFYSIKSGKCKSVSAFIEIVEEKLNVNPKSQFGPTQNNKIMWIKPSPWWIKFGMRRSLFTILLRAGLNYSCVKDNFMEAVASEKYLANTPYAFERFMSGHTKYAGHKRGWYKQFCEKNLSHEEIDKLLIKPAN